MLPLDELLTGLSEDEVMATFLTILEALEIPSSAWPTRGIAMTIVRVFARTVSSISKFQRLIAEAGFLDYATGAGLTLLARCVYGVERIPATFASGEETLTNTTGNTYSKAARGVIFVGVNGKSYTNKEPFTLGANATLTIPIEAIEQGSGSTAPAGTIIELETTMLGVLVTNERSVVGVDAEKDGPLRLRCRERIQAYGAGAPRGAYSYWARTAKRDDGSPVNINRVSTSRSSSTGRVVQTVASPTGAPATDDLEAIEATIEEKVRPDTVTYELQAATALDLAPVIDVYATRAPGLSADTIELSVATALANFAAQWPIGGRTKPPSIVGYLFEDAIAAAVVASHPAIYECDVSIGDTPLTATQVAVLTPTIHVTMAEAA